MSNSRVVFIESGDSIQAAIDLLSDGGTVVLGPGTYTVTHIDLDRDLAFVGAGMTETIINGGANGNYMFSKFSTDDWKISFRDITFSASAGTDRAGIGMSYSNGFSLTRCQFKNFGIWPVYIGVSDGLDRAYRNFDVSISGCVFDGMPSASTYEQLLIFNTRRVTIKETFFANLENVAIGLGFYQHVRDANVRNCTFTGFSADDGHGMYYTNSCRNIRLTNSNFYISLGVQGANQSDNELFAGRRAVDVNVVNCYVRAPGPGTGIQLGAVQGALVKGCLFWKAELFPLQVHRGNGVDVKSNDISIEYNRFIDSNNSNGLGYYNAGVLVQCGNGEDLSDYTISNNYFSNTGDDFMLYGITVDATGIHNTSGEPVHTNNHINDVTEIHYPD